jgi:SlyX protein
MTEEKFIDLESKIAQQDLLIEELHQVMYRQQRQLDQLEITLAGMAKRFREVTHGDHEVGPANERPPHY